MSEDSLNDIITRATIEAEVYLTNSELERISKAIKADIQQIAKDQREACANEFEVKDTRGLATWVNLTPGIRKVINETPLVI